MAPAARKGVIDKLMATATNKQRLLNQLLSALKKNLPAEEEALSVLEQFLYALCREGATREQADRAFRALRERFFDWNEVRVSSTRELEEALADLPDTELRAGRIISFLQEVFETTFSFDLEGLHKKGLKQAAKQLARYQAASDYVGAWVVQKTLGGHAIPVDAPALRTLRRLGLVEDGEEDLEAVRASLEHLIPKAKGAQFVDAVSDLARTTCWEDSPNCQACPLSAECPTGQEAPAVRPKPR
jgi:endonuclease III